VAVLLKDMREVFFERVDRNEGAVFGLGAT
jgi:hypothetical protein